MKGTVDAIFIVTRMQVGYLKKEKKLHICVLLTWKRLLIEFHERCCSEP